MIDMSTSPNDSLDSPDSKLISVRILGIPVHNITMESALSSIDGFIRSGKPHHIITADASMLVMAQDDPQLRSIILQADLVTPDSIGVLWAAGRKGVKFQGRVSGVEIVERLCSVSALKGYRLYFLGAAPGVASEAAERMCRLYPGASIVGTQDGYFSADETPAIIEKIKSCKPDAIFVAFGIPKQEKWIAEHRDLLGVPVYIGVGGTFDVLSGRVKRAPKIMRTLKLEWLWRVLLNPKKINKVLLLPRFVKLVFKS